MSRAAEGISSVMILARGKYPDEVLGWARGIDSVKDVNSVKVLNWVRSGLGKRPEVSEEPP